jgi:nitric oxide reductase activation protein
VTIDQEADDYLPYLFGKNGFPESIPIEV